MIKKTSVISIAAVSGGGKTTITNTLLTKLDNAVSLHFDDYEWEGCPEDICKWVEEGADYHEWNLTPLLKDIQMNLSNRSLKYIILDYPFAYLNKDIRDYIDLAIYLDTPLDIAMARRILRDCRESSQSDIRNELENYLLRGRFAYIEMGKSVMPNSDIVLDGSLSSEIIVDKIMAVINNRS